MNTLSPQLIVQTIQQTLPKVSGPIPLHEPGFNGNEWQYLKDCLDSGWVSSVGRYVDQFEQSLQEYTGIKHAIAVNTGTGALHVCLELAGVESNDEVLIPALTFVATANAVSYCGALPHFMDTDNITLGINAEQIEEYLKSNTVMRNAQCFNKHTQRRIPALIAMHTFGHPVDLDPLMEVCKRFQIALIEDAAESLGSLYKGKHTGSFGCINALSFNGNKIITSGGGGAIVTNDNKLAKLARHITSTAKLPHAWEYVHDQVAYNYRMPNLNAALGLAQLEKLDSFIKNKRNLAETYQTQFKEITGVQVFKEADYATSNYWLNVLLLNHPDITALNTILDSCHSIGLLTRPAWKLLPKLPMYEASQQMPLDNAENLANQIICLPSSPKLGST